jgi:ribosomal protein S27E
MFKRIAKKLFGGGPSGQSPEGFFLNARCDECGEVFNLFINKSTDLAQNFDERGGVNYSLNKEIIGSNCRNLIYVKMEFDGGKNVVSKKIENGEFIEED